ncbi:hypothetical protein [Peredibacter starrii]|uniref:Caspase domain-containing protein n=1 Tax=Peredibacter starrii TaxID=28202 RepID=A0AAX4HT30_9BACT|nr:hypothetical protein [Peredibacter starrii]WPU66323.1 hypothetical protein SOO65_06145 [Peredibacter starrii]
MSKVKTTLLLSLMTCAPLHAKNYMTFMGGGGEPAGPETIFDYQVKSIGDFNSNSTWETQVSFNGGHSKTEGYIADSFKRKATNSRFTESEYERIIKDYETKLNNGQITSGDQLMLVVTTHGSMKKRDDEKTHDVSVTGGAVQNFDTAEGSRMVSMDKLENLVKLAEKRGVKLAIIDLSCHSGNTLALNRPNTCIISATGPNHYGYAGGGSGPFTNSFIDSMKKGKSLEEVFLNARNTFSDLSFPMISSPVGMDLNEEMYDNITPYLYRYDSNHDKFSPYVTNEASKGEACEEPKNYQELTNLITQFEDIKKARGVDYSSRDGKKFRESVDRYYTLLTKMRTDLSKLATPKTSPKEEFCTEKDDGVIKLRSCMTLNQNEILSYNAEPLKKLYAKRIQSTSGKDKEDAEMTLERITKVERRQQQLIRENPDYAKRANFFKDWPKLEEETTRLSYEVAGHAKAFYQERYKQKASSDTRPNPCKDFIL